MRIARHVIGGAALIAALSLAAGAQAQKADFSGQTISIFAGSGAGSTYDLYSRLTADYLGKFIPGNPQVIVQNKPGAGGAVAASYVYNAAARDGTALGLVQQNLPLFQILSPKSVKYDFSKTQWIGTLTDIASVVAVIDKAGIKTLAEAKTKEIVMAATGQGSETYQVPMVLNATMGTKFRTVIGFKGVGDMDLAIERGEAVGRAGSLLSWTARKQDWIKSGKVTFLVQVGIAKAKEIPNVPLLLDLATDDRTRKMYAALSSASAVGRSIFAPPDVPAARLAMLRDGFDKMVADPEFKQAMAKRELPLNPIKGAEIQKVVADTIATPPAVVEELRKVLGFKG